MTAIKAIERLDRGYWKLRGRETGCKRFLNRLCRMRQDPFHPHQNLSGLPGVNTQKLSEAPPPQPPDGANGRDGTRRYLGCMPEAVQS
ncbi:hypothetical protein M8818_002447 [Zalaria obscura]|uniref:Uncharacterized protein n=1 Tax=Zalaria obscura TaxID=2024903 RepID=A0ACC3SMA1_9PEZI